MRKILHFLLFTSCTLFTGSLRAQTYPVQGNAFLIPPYSLRLSDYATSTSERLAVNVLLTDVTRAELRVRFRLHIEGPTISVDTKPEYIGSAIVLQGGISLRLTNLDLSEYFSFRNLNFTGISEREFLQKGTLPEGLYRICFDVLEYNRGVKIAQSICAQAFLALNAPPIINLPRQGETLRAQMPQNVIMQWTPRHTGSPNSAFNTQYEIRVVEVWPSDRNPNDAILTQPSIYETTTTNTTLIYGPDATQLEPGRTYALRVRAVPMGEADQLDLFTNNGYSETVSFVYGQTCKPPAAVTGKVTGPHTSTLDWLQDNNHTAYKIHLRKQGSHDWRLHRSNITTIDLKDLDANTNYEYEVGAVCGDFESPYSALGTLKTMEAQTPLYDCGAKPKGQLNTNQEPLPELKVGDKVHTLTVEVTITKVTGGNGTFSGEAEARLKIFNKALMSLVFKDIRVNKDYWLIGGYFEAVNGRVELPKGVQEGVDLLGDVLSESQGGGTSNDYKTPPPDPNTFAATEMITIPDGIQSITKDEKTGQVTVTDTKGVKHVLPQGKDVAVADENGRGALVDKHGQITNTTAEQAKAAAKREYGFSIVFEKAPESKAGFDTYDKKTTALKNTYETIEQYHVPWKAIGTSADAVKGSINFGTAKDLVFEQEGAKLTYNEFTNILTVNPVAAGSTAHVIVKEKTGDKEKIRGKLNVVGYTPITKTVHIIPVNNAASTVSEADLKKYLDDVYGQALVSWQVDLKNKIAISLTGDFDDGASGLLSTYTADMRKVIKAYGKLENDQYYLFLIESGKNKTGYMPRGKRAGFIFLNNQNAEDLKHTIAHELGHGAFTLRHPFAEYPAVTAKSTDNLMDYAGGTHLYKWQWDQIHNPVLVIGLFEGDSEGENYRVEIDAKFLNKDKLTVSFLSKTGSVISLPRLNIGKVELSYGAVTAPNQDPSQGLTYTFDNNVGCLHAFSLLNDNKFDYYKYNSVAKTYETKEGKKYNNSTDYAQVDGVIYPISSGTDFTLYKFTKGGLPSFTEGAGKTMTFSEVSDVFKPFTDANSPVRGNEGILKQVIPNSISKDCIWCRDTNTANMTAPYLEKPELYFIDKIAQLRNVFPEYFKRFTQINENWASPIDDTQSITVPNTVNTAIINVPYTNWQWGKYLSKNPVLKSNFTGKTNLREYFKTFCYVLKDSIDAGIKNESRFWVALNSNTPALNVVQHLNTEPFLQITKAPLGKRLLALKILTNGSLQESKEDAAIKIMGSIAPENQSEALSYIAANIGLKNIFNKFHDIFGEDNFTRVATLLTTFITNPRTNENAMKLMAGLDPKLTSVDVDLWDNRKTEGYYIDNDNNVHFYNRVTLAKKFTDDQRSTEIDQEFLVVPYNELMPVEFWSSFQLADKTFRKRDVITMPAIFAALLVDKAGRQLFSKKAWIVVDGLMLAIGAGEVKILFSTASWIRKAIVASDIVGSSAAIIDGMVTEGTIPAAMRQKISYAYSILQLPMGIRSLGELSTFLNKTAQDIRQIKNLPNSNLSPAAQKKLDDFVVVLERNGYGGFSPLKTSLLTKSKDFANIKAWINGLDDATDAGLLAKLDNLEAGYFSRFDADLVHPTYGSEIKLLLKESPDDLNDIWKRLKDDPAYSWELQKTGGSRWEKWSQREFFKDITAKGSNFEKNTCLIAFKNRSSEKYLELKTKFSNDFGKNLDEYEMYSQVQLKYDGDNYFVADQLFVKYKTNTAGEIVVDDILVIENKLSATTQFTTPQSNAFTKNSFIVRSINKISETDIRLTLEPGSIINFKDAKQIYKVHDGVNGNTISGISKL